MMKRIRGKRADKKLGRRMSTDNVTYRIMGRCDECKSESIIVKDMKQGSVNNFVGVWTCKNGCVK